MLDLRSKEAAMSAEQSTLLPPIQSRCSSSAAATRTPNPRAAAYLIQWADNAHGRWYNAWYTPPSPQLRKYLYQGRSDDDAKAHCRSHAMFNVSKSTEGEPR